MNPAIVGLILAGLMLFAPARVAAQGVLPDDYELAEDEPQAQDESDEPRARPTKRDSEPLAASQKATSPRRMLNRRQTSGLGFTLGLGALSTLRRMTFAGTDHTIRHQPGIYLGGALKASQLVLTFDTLKSHLLVEAEGGYGSAKNADVEPALGRPLTTEHAYLLVLGMFEQPIHRDVDLRLGLGLSALSFTVEQNPQYTGHRYIALAASFGANYWLSKKVHAGGSLVFYPGISTNQSSGDYGAARSFGGRAEAHISWRFLQPEPPDLFASAQIGTRYALTRYQTTMPETQVLGDLAATADTSHTLTITLSYNL